MAADERVPCTFEDDLADLHDFIWDEDEDGVKEILEVYEENEDKLRQLVTQELDLDDSDLGFPVCALHKAALVGSVNILQLLIENGDLADIINVPCTTTGETALHYAVWQGRYEAVNYLATRCNKSLVNTRQFKGHTPMHVACEFGKTDIARLLVIKGADIEILDAQNRSPLHIAAGKGYSKLVAFFLKKSINTNTQDCRGQTALHHAQVGRHLACTHLLLRYPHTEVEITDKDGNSPLYLAILNVQAQPSGSQGTDGGCSTSESDVDEGCPATPSSPMSAGLGLLPPFSAKISCPAKLLLHSGCSVTKVNVNGDTALHLAVKSGSADLVSLVLSRGAEVKARNKMGQTALFNAKQKAVVDILLAAGCNVTVTDNEGTTALHVLAGHPEAELGAVESLISHGALVNAPNKKKCTSLHSAAASGLQDKLTLLLNNGGDVTHSDSLGRNVLHMLTQGGYWEAAKQLIMDVNIDVDKPDAQGNNVLHHSVDQNATDFVRFLVGRGVKLNIGKSSNSPVAVACQNNNRDIVRLLLENGAKIPTLGVNGLVQTCLHLFANDDDLDMLSQVLESNSRDIDVLNYISETALHVAVKQSCWDGVNILLDAGSSPQSKDKNGNCPLHSAVANMAPLSTIGQLIQKGALVNAQNANNNTALHIAVTKQYPTCVRMLLDNGADINITNTDNLTPLISAFSIAIGTDNKDEALETLEEFIDSPGNIDTGKIDSEKRTALHLASILGLFDMAEWLVEQGAPVNAVDSLGKVPLHYASEQSSFVDGVKLLIDSKSDIEAKDSEGKTPLLVAAEAKRSQAAAALLDAGCDVNVIRKDGKSSLHLSVINNDSETTNLLIKHKCNVNIRDNGGVQALQYAVQYATGKVIHAILHLVDDVNLTDNSGQTALHYSMNNSDPESLACVLLVGPDVDIQDNNGNTALHTAAMLGRFEHADFLLSHGCELNLRNKSKQTCLHLSAPHPETDILELLISNEAELNHQDAQGKTAAHIAVQNGNWEGLSCLLGAKANVKLHDIHEQSLLHYIAKCTGEVRKSVIPLLLQGGLALTDVDDAGKTPINIALACENDAFLSFIDSLQI